MKAIRTIRTYAPRTLSTSEAKEMISKSLFTRKMAFKVAGKRTSKAEFERSAEGTTTQIIMTKKLNLYCMGNGNEETRFHLTFNVVIMPEVTTEEATTEELDTFVSELKNASKPKTSKVGGLSQNSKVEPTVSSTEKVVHFTNTGKDLAQTLREKIAEKEAYIREKSGSGWVTEAYIGYQKGELAGLKKALSLIE